MRIRSIDILRGLIMIIMAIDHTRDFFHIDIFKVDPLDPAANNPALFFTRWITHFCAPIFVFLSGISAYLASLKRSKADASMFLVKRGLWLVIAEVTLVTFGITFNPFFNFIVFQVIWAIGWSMILLGIMSRVSSKLVLVLGILLFFGHNVLDYFDLAKTGVAGHAWNILFRSTGVIALDETHFIGVFYSILPWTGVMFLGYSIGNWFRKDVPSSKRQKLLLGTGGALILLFVLLRSTNIYGNPTPFVGGNGFTYDLLAFINTSKYPPSLQFLCMTLGPGCILLGIFENISARWTRIVSIYGSVPFFYYILHFYLLHIILMILFFTTGHTTSEIADPRHPFFFRPWEFGYGLPGVYAIWLLVVLLLYFPCKWFSNYKKTHSGWWLSYV
jgi:uncharacterized membrane protein